MGTVQSQISFFTQYSDIKKKQSANKAGCFLYRCFRIARRPSNFDADGHLPCQEYNYTPSTKTPRKTQITASRGHTQSVMNFGVLIILSRNIIFLICRYTFSPCFRIARSTSNFNADGHLPCREYNYTPSTKTPRKTQITASQGHTQSVMNFGVLFILSKNIIFLICRYTFSPFRRC